MTDTNYLRDSLKAAGAEQVSTCKLCGILVNGSYQHAHNQVHYADYEPFATASPGAAETCTLCGALVNSSYQEAHNRGHG